MQGKGKWQLEVKKYGYKQRKKKVLTLFESKIKANPYSLYLFAIIFLVIGIFVYLHFLDRNEELRLKSPETISVKLIESRCYGSSKNRRPRGPHMSNTYIYSPKLDSGRVEIYKINDSVSYVSEEKCKVDLHNSKIVSLRSHALYDTASPWNASWTLDQRSPAPLLWFTSSLSLLMFVFGLVSHRKNTVRMDCRVANLTFKRDSPRTGRAP